MKHFLKKTCVLLAATLAAGMLQGCQAKEKEDDFRVVATVFPSYDFAKQIGGEDAEVSLLLTPGAESHAYEPTASDIAKIQSCDVFLYIGGESEVWVDKILSGMDTSHMEIVRLFDAVDPLAEELQEGMEAEDEHEEHDHEDDEPEYDEHIWASPENAKKMTEMIADAMCKQNPEKESAMRAKETAYVAQLDQLDADYRKTVEDAARDTIVIGDRFPFRYLTQAYDIEYYAAFVGCSSETEASAATLSFLIQKVKDESLPVVFHTESSAGKIAKRIQDATGAEIRMLHSCNNVTKAELDEGATYLSLMEQNREVLEYALSK